MRAPSMGEFLGSSRNSYHRTVSEVATAYAGNGAPPIAFFGRLGAKQIRTSGDHARRAKPTQSLWRVRNSGVRAREVWNQVGMTRRARQPVASSRFWSTSVPP